MVQVRFDDVPSTATIVIDRAEGAAGCSTQTVWDRRDLWERFELRWRAGSPKACPLSAVTYESSWRGTFLLLCHMPAALIPKVLRSSWACMSSLVMRRRTTIVLHATRAEQTATAVSGVWI